MPEEFDRAKARAFTQLMVRHLEGAAVTLMLIGAAIAASYLPARRAMRMNPVIALRRD